jgi:hypothetical protein
MKKNELSKNPKFLKREGASLIVTTFVLLSASSKLTNDCQKVPININDMAILR